MIVMQIKHKQNNRILDLSGGTALALYLRLAIGPVKIARITRISTITVLLSFCASGKCCSNWVKLPGSFPDSQLVCTEILCF
jgi:hypothetical protein